MEQPRKGPHKRAGEKGPNLNARRSSGFFAKSISQRKEFLRVYATSGSIPQAAGYIGVAPETVYDYRKKNPGFAMVMEKVRRRFRQELEGAAFKRGVKGWIEPVHGKEGRIGQIRRFSDRLLELLLKKNIAEFTDKVEVETTGTVAQIGLEDLRKLSPEGREKLREVLIELGGTDGSEEKPS